MSTVCEITYTYIRTEPQLWTTGFYNPEGQWEPENDFPTPEEAAKRVSYLNGENTLDSFDTSDIISELEERPCLLNTNLMRLVHLLNTHKQALPDTVLLIVVDNLRDTQLLNDLKATYSLMNQ